jgi:hypothetical protein
MLPPAVKLAVTLRACVIVTWQEPIPLHAPDHPANVWPLTGVAVSVTLVPLLNAALQFPLAFPAMIEQLIPPTLAVTLPFPVPLPVTVSTGFAEKVATKDRFALAVKV